jgi:hypothetical protein
MMNKQKYRSKTMNTTQAEMIIAEDLVPENHTYRKLKKLIDFSKLIKAAKLTPKAAGAIGYRLERLVMCLILQ